MKLDIDTRGVRQAGGLLDVMGRKAKNLKPAWPGVIRTLIVGERLIFTSRGASIGNRWPELKASTRRIKAKQGMDPRPMVATGGILGELTSPSGVRSMTGTELRWGTSKFYARFHPDRPVVGAGRVERRKIARQVLEHLTS